MLLHECQSRSGRNHFYCSSYSPCNVIFLFLNLPNSVNTLKPLNVSICCFVGRGATVQYI